jgi:hypothetical protein
MKTTQVFNLRNPRNLRFAFVFLRVFVPSWFY